MDAVARGNKEKAKLECERVFTNRDKVVKKMTKRNDGTKDFID